MYKVLIVEDDPIQIEWAKKVLDGMPVQVVFASAVVEVDSKIQDQDFILTDLEIPREPFGQTCPDNGLKIFDYYLKCQDKYRGFAIVSNFEHHCRCGRRQEDIEMLNNSIYQKLRYIKMVGHIFFPHEGKIDYRLGKINIGVFLDSVGWRDYPAYVVNGATMDNDSFRAMADNRDMTSLLRGLRGEEVIFLKPWREVLQALIEGAEKEEKR